MTPERFEHLADAWGADLHRWPAAERDAAQVLLAHDTKAQALIARAAELDAVLDAHAVAPPGIALRQGLLDRMQALPQPARRSTRSTRWRLPARWWWSGAGVAGLGLAGAAAGALAVSMALATVVPTARQSAVDGAWASSAFDAGGPSEWSDE